MQICYECLEKQCTQQEIVLWKSDFLYAMVPKRCGFCGERGPGRRKSEKNFTKPLDKKGRMM